MIHLYTLHVPTGTRMNYEKTFETSQSVFRYCRRNHIWFFITFETIYRKFSFYHINEKNRFECSCYGYFMDGMVI